MYYIPKFQGLSVLLPTDDLTLDTVQEFLSANGISPEFLGTTSDNAIIVKLATSPTLVILPTMAICVEPESKLVMGLAPQLLELFYVETKPDIQ